MSVTQPVNWVNKNAVKADNRIFLINNFLLKLISKLNKMRNTFLKINLVRHNFQAH